MINKFLILSLFLPLFVSAQTIALDVGHYLKSPGTVSAYGDYEFYYNKELSQFVGNALVQSGYKVNIQGYNGDLSSLSQRGELANKSDFLISLHHDAIQAQHLSQWSYNGKNQIYSDEVRGFGIFVSAKNPQFKKSLVCAKTIANQLMQAGFKANYYHSLDIPNERKELLDSKLPVYKYDNLIVLKGTQVPAILIEAGVLTHRQEALWIKQNDVRTAFAYYVAAGMKQCF
jgi:N-acetylmuramoyl-L-alanine amidase